MATKAKTTVKNEYTVRTEWTVTYYCDTTVKATSREDAARIVMQEGEPDYDSQESYDDSGDTYVAGVSEGTDYDCMADFGAGIPEGMGEPEQVDAAVLATCRAVMLEAAAAIAANDAGMADRLVAAAKSIDC
jgi:hypothetical protein